MEICCSLEAIAVTFKVIVAGTRTFDNYNLLKRKLDYYLSDRTAVEIVSGGARGADSLGEKYAREKGFAVKVFAANWDKYGKSAGPRRNKDMAEYADALVLFWDGVSRGSASMLELAREYNLLVRVVRY